MSEEPGTAAATTTRMCSPVAGACTARRRRRAAPRRLRRRVWRSPGAVARGPLCGAGWPRGAAQRKARAPRPGPAPPRWPRRPSSLCAGRRPRRPRRRRCRSATSAAAAVAAVGERSGTTAAVAAETGRPFCGRAFPQTLKTWCCRLTEARRSSCQGFGCRCCGRCSRPRRHARGQTLCRRPHVGAGFELPDCWRLIAVTTVRVSSL